ncbi:MAG TPA: hypothetical protein VLI94_09115 [Solirubrobacterales bacterium]|nr:hypothetical protein [Solirubrobacterales bacterium]
MKRDPLGQALREAAIPVPAEAEERGLRMVAAAHAQRQPQQRRQVALPRLALALAIATLLAALLLSPAGAAVRDWVDDVVTSSTPRPEPELAEIPGGGQLLVQSADGPWVVQADGSRRLLGDYEEATWSPRGLFVAVADGRTLSALEPDGTPRWSITAPVAVGEPRWAPLGERIAYRAGRVLRIVAGDGTDDRLFAASAAPVAPAWDPTGRPQLAYVTAAGRLIVAHSETGALLASSPALPDVTQIEWGAGGAAILEASPRALRLRSVRNRKIAARPAVDLGAHLPVPRRQRVVDAALSAQSRAVAVVLRRGSAAGGRSSVLLFDPRKARPQRLLDVPGDLGEVVWSPDGSRLLIAMPVSDQWLFLPTGRGFGSAVSNISDAFSPGRPALSFPRVEGWCCRR